MNAVPLALKRAIGAGIGLFILFIGFVNGGFIATPAGGVPIVGPVFPTTTAQFLFLAGLLFTMVLWVLKVRGALIISILVITIVALILGIASVPKEFSATPRSSPSGRVSIASMTTAAVHPGS
jgi:AGZA family xanthine/uracil permease-like MFS transporter